MSIKAIETRRSIRKYKETPVQIETINKVISAGILAPSGKNRQPWNFIVVGGKEKENMLKAFQNGIDREKSGNALLPGSKGGIADAQNTLNIMKQAPVVIMVLNQGSGSPFQNIRNEDRVAEIIDIQSIGAAIENMLLAAEDLGLGTLWIGNTFFAYSELCKWLNTDKQLVAAIAIGYPDEKPAKRPRKELKDVVEYRL
ncbi:MAG TPA: nitroreductase family protein [Caproiciproducens sp.]|nr:nitroreductase family protein [Caproiciproducens sp.]